MYIWQIEVKLVPKNMKSYKDTDKRVEAGDRVKGFKQQDEELVGRNHTWKLLELQPILTLMLIYNN